MLEQRKTLRLLEDKFLRMAAAFAHQMRNPVQIIQSTTEFSLDHLSPQGALKENLQRIAQHAGRLGVMLNAFLNFSKAGKCCLQKGDVNAVLEAASAAIEFAAKKQGVVVQKELSPLPQIMLDANALQGAFYNLMANAVEAMPRGGVLSLKTTAGARGPSLIIGDTGEGMDAGVLARLGEAFFSTKENGTGLGLFIVKQILQEHHGELRWESRRGLGTRAWINFPRVNHA